jgi:hypothetical protein
METQAPEPKKRSLLVTILIILAIIVGICFLIPICVIVILSLLGPAIGNVFSNVLTSV